MFVEGDGTMLFGGTCYYLSSLTDFTPSRRIFGAEACLGFINGAGCCKRS